jgi:hypothetical protein
MNKRRRTIMKVVIGALLLAIGLIGIPIALVAVPAAAVRDTETGSPAADPDSAREHCGVRMECLQ